METQDSVPHARVAVATSEAASASPLAVKDQGRRFLRLPDDLSEWENSYFVIIPAPLEETVSWGGGASIGPSAIIAASQHMESFDLESGTGHVSPKLGICTLDRPWEDGDSETTTVASFPDEGSVVVGHALFAIENTVRHVRAAGKLPVMLGGEHTVTLGALRALAGEGITLLVLDAHADLRDEWEGEQISHATVTRRAIDDLGIPVVLFGVRSASRQGWEFLVSKKKTKGFKGPFVKAITAKDIWSEDWERVLSKLARAVQGKKLYVSIDIDVLDPSEAPAVGTPEPGGMRFRQVLDALFTAISACKEVVGFDVVETAPIKGEKTTEYLAASIVYRMIGACGRKKTE